MPKPFIERDKYFKQAKKVGYRARSAFKLLEIQKKLKVMRAGDSVLDLGCFPGSWLQVETEIVGENGFVLGVDLTKTELIEGAETMVANIFHEKTLSEIKKRRPKKFDVVLSDMAPNTTGLRDVDQYKSVQLNIEVLRTAKELLKKNGNLVTKIFVGEDFAGFYKEFRKYFKTVKQVKPKATRDRSFEIYLVGLSFSG